MNHTILPRPVMVADCYLEAILVELRTLHEDILKMRPETITSELVELTETPKPKKAKK